MTVNELIKLLQAYPLDMQVVAEGYEDGFDDVLNAEQIKLKPIEIAKWYVGAYDRCYDGSGTDAVLIKANNKGKDID